MSHIYFETHANDLGRAQAFYESLFGWTFDKNPHAPVEYYSIETGGTRGGLLQRPLIRHHQSAAPMRMSVQ